MVLVSTLGKGERIKKKKSIMSFQQSMCSYVTELAIACSKLTIETLELGMKYVQS